jgi:hypothetical protein
MKNLTVKLFVSLPVQIYEYGKIEVLVTYHWDNDGIGHYEFWGSKCYDAGSAYVEIDDIQPIFSAIDSEDIKKEVINYIDDNFEKCAEELVPQIEEMNNEY